MSGFTATEVQNISIFAASMYKTLFISSVCLLIAIGIQAQDRPLTNPIEVGRDSAQTIQKKDKRKFSLTDTSALQLNKSKSLPSNKFLDFLYKLDSAQIRTWRITANLGEIIPIPMDTAVLNFQQFESPYYYSPALDWTGNKGQAAQSKLFFDRPEQDMDFIFLNNMRYYWQDPSEFINMNTKVPFTNLTYLRTFVNNTVDEEHFRGKFGVNVNKRLNMGFFLDYIYARGMYQNQLSSLLNGGVFTNYLGNRYQLHFYFIGANMKTQENGGITDPRYISNPNEMAEGRITFQPRDIPVHLSNTGATNDLYTVNLSHRFNLGYEKTHKTDSARIEFVPVSSIIHTFRFDYSNHKFFERNVQKSYFDTTYYNPNSTKDSTSYWRIYNTVGLSLREGFQKWALFGLTAYVSNDTRQYLLQSTDKGTIYQSYTETDFWVGADMFRRQGRVFNYNANAEFCFAGAHIGSLNIIADLTTKFRIGKKDTLTIRANGYFKHNTPDFYHRQYNSNHYKWENNFDGVIRAKAWGEVAIPTQRIFLSVGFENINNYIFFNSKGVPEQYKAGLQILSARLNLNLKFGPFHLDNDVSWQTSSNQSVLPLPEFTLYHNLYFTFRIAKVLKTQIGADVRFFTRYKAPRYNPATRQYQTQDTEYVGEYPLVSAYANFHLKQMRFFVMGTNIVQLFTAGAYFNNPNYPLNPALFKVGLSWNFFD